MRALLALLITLCLFLCACSNGADLHGYGLNPTTSAVPEASQAAPSSAPPPASSPPSSVSIPDSKPEAVPEVIDKPANTSSSVEPNPTGEAPISSGAPASSSVSSEPPREQQSSSTAPSSPESKPAPPPQSAASSQPEKNYEMPSSSTSGQLLEEAFLSSLEDELIALTNQRRASLGLSTLTYNSTLRQAARTRSREMYSNSYFDHRRPDGAEWHTVLDLVGLPKNHACENIAKGSYVGAPGQSDNLLSAVFWQTEWENSPSHYASIVDAEVTHIGIGFYYVVTDSKVEIYATALFAKL